MSPGGSVVCNACSDPITDQETTLAHRALAALGCYAHRRDGVGADAAVWEMLAARANVDTPAPLVVCLECVVRAIGLIGPGAEVRPQRDAATSW